MSVIKWIKLVNGKCNAWSSLEDIQRFWAIEAERTGLGESKIDFWGLAELIKGNSEELVETVNPKHKLIWGTQIKDSNLVRLGC